MTRRGIAPTPSSLADAFYLPLPDFAARTRIETPQGESVSSIPFDLWPAQQDVLTQMEVERLLVILKARQLGISWLADLFALHLCCTQQGRLVLIFSQGQLEANEMIRRISFMYDNHRDRDCLPALVTDNTAELEWSNGSRVMSLPATKRAGRSFTASLVILDEFAFMLFGSQLLGAAKPTINDGGRLWVISTADGPGTPFHQFWQKAEAGANGFKPIFLPWQAHPHRPPGWRDRLMAESIDPSAVIREYPENPVEAFSYSGDRIYDVWSDGPPDGNVTEAAEYQVDAGPVLWWVDDGYAGKWDRDTGHYTSDSHPRVFLLVQEKPDGHLDVFQESYIIHVLPEDHITLVNEMNYPGPDYAVVDKSAAELRGRLHAAGIPTTGSPDDVKESIKVVQRFIAKDSNGWRRVRVHPRCSQLRYQMAAYRRDPQTEKPIKEADDGPDALRYGVWQKRNS